MVLAQKKPLKLSSFSYIFFIFQLHIQRITFKCCNCKFFIVLCQEIFNGNFSVFYISLVQKSNFLDTIYLKNLVQFYPALLQVCLPDGIFLLQFPVLCQLLLWNRIFINSNRCHCSNLHRNIFCNLSFNFTFIKTNQSSQFVSRDEYMKQPFQLQFYCNMKVQFFRR